MRPSRAPSTLNGTSWTLTKRKTPRSRLSSLIEGLRCLKLLSLTTKIQLKQLRVKVLPIIQVRWLPSPSKRKASRAISETSQVSLRATVLESQLNATPWLLRSCPPLPLTKITTRKARVAKLHLPKRPLLRLVGAR